MYYAKLVGFCRFLRFDYVFWCRNKKGRAEGGYPVYSTTGPWRATQACNKPNCTLERRRRCIRRAILTFPPFLHLNNQFLCVRPAISLVYCSLAFLINDLSHPLQKTDATLFSLNTFLAITREFFIDGKLIGQHFLDTIC